MDEAKEEQKHQDHQNISKKIVEVDFSAIENQKENIVPISSGRSISKLSKLFNNKNDHNRIKGKQHHPSITTGEDGNDAEEEDFEGFNPVKASDELKKVHSEFKRKIEILEVLLENQKGVSKDSLNDRVEELVKDEDEREEFKRFMKDPLEIYVQYVRWTIESYPSGGSSSESNLIQLLETSTRKFQKSKTYRNDLRYLKLWMIYSDQKVFARDRKDLFNFLMVNQIGIDFGLFYEEFSKVLIDLKDFKRLREVLEFGIDRLKKLKRVRAKKDFEEENEEERLVKILDSIPAMISQNQKSQKTNNEDEPSSSTTSRTKPSHTNNNRSKPKNKLKVFEDGKDGEEDGEEGDETNDDRSSSNMMRRWDDLGTIKSNQRQNLIDPTIWRGQKLPMNKANMDQNSKPRPPKMKIFEDIEDRNPDEEEDDEVEVSRPEKVSSSSSFNRIGLGSSSIPTTSTSSKIKNNSQIMKI